MRTKNPAKPTGKRYRSVADMIRDTLPKKKAEKLITLMEELREAEERVIRARRAKTAKPQARMKRLSWA